MPAIAQPVAPAITPAPAVGQIWRELYGAGAIPRFVRVEHVTLRILIRTVVRGRTGWSDAPRSRSTAADPGRFNGKRGGYEFVEAT